MSGLKFPDVLVPDLLKRYQQYGAHPMPDADTLGSLLKLAFFASLEREEGRPLRFSLGLLTPDCLGSSSQDTWAPLRFHRPRPASVAEVARLALATDPRQTIIAVAPMTGRLELCGLVRTNLDHFRMARNESSSATSTVLWYPRVTVDGVGSIKIGMHDAEFARFAQGRQLAEPVNVLRAPGAVHDHLNTLAAVHLAEENGVSPGGLYARVIGHVLQRIADSGHGGTLVLLAAEEALTDATVKYQSRGGDLRGAFLEYWKALREKGQSEPGFRVRRCAAPRESAAARAVARNVTLACEMAC